MGADVLDENSFPGKQNDEVVLYRAKPHMIYHLWVYFKLCVYLAPLYIGLYFLPYLWGSLGSQGKYRIGLAIGLFTLILFFVIRHHLKSIVMYLTDRRIVRFASWPLGFRNRRALFWKEVTKNKGFPPNLLLRLFRVGTIVARSRSTEHDNVFVPGMYYYDDLINYMDKLLHLVTTNRFDEAAALHRFVLKPKWRRYPVPGQEIEEDDGAPIVRR